MYSINYSTAKTLMRMHKFNMIPYDLSREKKETLAPVESNSWKRCEYRMVEDQPIKVEQGCLDYASFSPNGSSTSKKDFHSEHHEEFNNFLNKFKVNKIEIISSVLLS